MRVVFVSSGKKHNNISPIIENQGKSLIANGIDISYYTINNKGLFGYIKHISYLRKFLKKGKYDIIHAHYGLSAWVCIFAKTNEKLLVSFMGDDIIGSNRKNGTITISSKLIASINKLLTKYVYDYAIVKSEEMKNKMWSRNIEVIPNGVDLELFKPIPYMEARKKINVISNAKIQAYFISDPNRIEKNFNFANNLINELKSIYQIELFVIHNIQHNQLVNYYNAANFLIMTSYHEGSPNVIKEAMACNCPIITTDVGDVRWVIGDTEGCIISSFDRYEFKQGLIKIIEYSMYHKKTNGRQRIINLGLENNTINKRISGIYSKLI